MKRLYTSTKTRPRANCSSDHEPLIGKFRLKLKKVGKTTRQFSLFSRSVVSDFLRPHELQHARHPCQPTPVFLPGEFQGWGSLVRLPSMGSHRVGHNWNDLAAAAAAAAGCIYIFSIRQSYLLSQAEHRLISFQNVLLCFWGHTRTHWIKI